MVLVLIGDLLLPLLGLLLLLRLRLDDAVQQLLDVRGAIEGRHKTECGGGHGGHYFNLLALRCVVKRALAALFQNGTWSEGELTETSVHQEQSRILSIEIARCDYDTSRDDDGENDLEKCEDKLLLREDVSSLEDIRVIGVG